jgi:hypothetical protein
MPPDFPAAALPPSFPTATVPSGWRGAVRLPAAATRPDFLTAASCCYLMDLAVIRIYVDSGLLVTCSRLANVMITKAF